MKFGPAVVGALVALNVVSWIILLAGVASVQAYCEDHNSSHNCGATYSLAWWITWFQFFILVVACLSACVRSLKGLRLATIAMLAMVSTLMMQSARESYEALEFGNLQSGLKTRVRCWMGGLCLSMIFNLLLVFVFSMMDGNNSAPEFKEAKTAPAGQVPPVVTPVPAQAQWAPAGQPMASV